jgi:hypothetical protein
MQQTQTIALLLKKVKEILPIVGGGFQTHHDLPRGYPPSE